MAIEIESLRYEDIHAVVTLHRKVLTYSLNSKLGDSHLTDLYKNLCEDSSCMIKVARERENIVGVVSAALKPQRVMSQLISNLTLKRMLGLIGKFTLHPFFLLEWAENVWLGHPVRFKGRMIDACLLAIVVQAESQRLGIGRSLIKSVDNFFLTNNCFAYRLDSRKDNQSSSAFYQQMRFIAVEQRGRNIMWVRELQSPHIGH